VSAARSLPARAGGVVGAGSSRKPATKTVAAGVAAGCVRRIASRVRVRV